VTGADGEPKEEVVVREEVQDGTRIPLRLSEGATVTVEAEVEEDENPGEGFTVAVMSLNSMESKTVTGKGSLVTGIDEEGEYLVDVTGGGRGSVRVVRG